LSLNLSKCSIKELLEKSISPYLLSLEKRNGKIKISGNDFLLSADDHHLTHLFSNIIDNAIKYSHEEPTINIVLSQSKGAGIVAISDNGIGMSDDEQKNIFKKFYRVPTGNIHNIKGFGIGLNYAKSIVQLHKGKISVESDHNKGATFTIYFPAE
jgi:two-component system phosphate regulon sensor histidine kinase PhoR